MKFLTNLFRAPESSTNPPDNSQRPYSGVVNLRVQLTLTHANRSIIITIPNLESDLDGIIPESQEEVDVVVDDVLAEVENFLRSEGVTAMIEELEVV